MKDNKLNLSILAFAIITLSVAIYFGLAKQRYIYNFEKHACFDTNTGKLYYIEYDENKVCEIDYVSGAETTRKYKKYVD